MKKISDKRTLLLGLMVFAAACNTDITAPLTANPAHGVLITVAVPGRCIVGGCDPPGGGRTTLALITVRNTSSATAYLAACGQQAAISEQQLVDGQWQFVGPAITCPVTPGPIVLAAGDSLEFNDFLATGTWREVAGVATTASLADEAPSTSAAFDIH